MDNSRFWWQAAVVGPPSFSGDHFKAIIGPGKGADSAAPGQLVGSWSAYLTSATGFQSGYGPGLAFNGLTTGSPCLTNGASSSVVFAPSTTLNVTELAIYSGMVAGGTLEWNGNTVSTVQGSWTVITDTGELSATNPMVLTSTATSAVNLAAVRVNGEILVDASILVAAQQTFPDGLWWIKGRKSANQHQLVDSVNGTTNVIQSPARTTGNTYTAPTSESVAWCWNAGNTDGGFSITNGTHGLGVVPAMVIDRKLNVWHQSLPAGQGLVLSSSAAAAAQAWTVSATTVTGPGGGPYYAWTEIPSHSAYGSYQGDNNVDGPFVYTGFKPDFVLIKSTATGDWHIYDSVREASDPKTLVLRPNMTNAESAVGSIDFLSDGFKLQSAAPINTTATFIYAAFQQSPVTAR